MTEVPARQMFGEDSRSEADDSLNGDDSEYVLFSTGKTSPVKADWLTRSEFEKRTTTSPGNMSPPKLTD